MNGFIMKMADSDIVKSRYLSVECSNFATYYPSIWTIHPCHTTSRGTNYFLKEPPDAILGPCFWYVEIHRD